MVVVVLEGGGYWGATALPSFTPNKNGFNSITFNSVTSGTSQKVYAGGEGGRGGCRRNFSNFQKNFAAHPIYYFQLFCILEISRPTQKFPTALTQEINAYFCNDGLLEPR